jgi:serine/threonine protein kinase
MTRYTRKKKGGRLLGQGQYGCAFEPALKCKGESTIRPGISKLLPYKEDAYKEINTSEKILKIDPSRKYFITSSGNCHHDGISINRSLNKSKRNCKHNPKNKFTSQMYLVFYPMGGEGIDKIIIRPDKYGSFIRGFRNLIEGLKILHGANMFHADIKPDNILSKFENNEYNLRFIDFGLTVTDTTLLTYDSYIINVLSSHEYDNYHPYYPIDIILMSRNTRYNNNFIRNWYNMVNQYGISPQSSYFDKNYNPIININKLNDQYSNNVKFYNDTSRAVKSIDIAALGISISEVYSRITGHYSRLDVNGNETISIKIPGYNYKVFIMELTVKHFKGQQDILNWHLEVAKNVSMNMFYLIRKMINYNGAERVTASEALTIFDKFINNIDYYFSISSLTKRALNMININVDDTANYSAQSTQLTPPQPTYLPPPPPFQALKTQQTQPPQPTYLPPPPPPFQALKTQQTQPPQPTYLPPPPPPFQALKTQQTQPTLRPLATINKLFQKPQQIQKTQQTQQTQQPLYKRHPEPFEVFKFNGSKIPLQTIQPLVPNRPPLKNKSQNFYQKSLLASNKTKKKINATFNPYKNIVNGK